MKGRCSCGAVEIVMLDKPLFTQCCHCTWCQRETGTGFGLNALIETPALRINGDLDWVTLASPTKGKELGQCPRCRVTLLAYYGGQREIAALRVGVLEDPSAFPPDIHVHTTTKLPWLEITDGKPQCAGYYKAGEMWPPDSLARLRALKG